MPTKPSRKSSFKSTKHGKDYLDEAVAKSGYYRKPITKKRAILAGILAIPFGSTGIHNYIMHNAKRGFIQGLIGSITFAMVIIPLSYGIMAYYRKIDISGYDDTLNAILIIGLIGFAISLIWGIVEGIIILTHIGKFVDNETKK